MQWHQNPAERRQHSSAKWCTYSDNELPLWVADMDCVSPPCVNEILKAAIQHGIFGYGLESPGFRDAWVTHLKLRHQWEINPDWICPVAGVVPGMRMALMAHPECRDILIPSPCYPYFQTVPKIEGRTHFPVNLWPQNGALYPETEAIKKVLLSTKNRPAILWCNPQNPGGTVYCESFIKNLCAEAENANALIISDEIWADLILSEKSHVPIGKMAPENQPTITLMAATKTFNVAGFGCAVAIIPEANTRKRFKETLIAMPHVMPIAYKITEACLKEGQDWYQGLIEALRANKNQITEWAKSHPELSIITGDASFLAWIKSRNADAYLNTRFCNAGVRLSGGTPFGDPEAVRLNFGCSPDTLTEALNRMNSAL